MAYTNVDRELRELALTRWDVFIAVTGLDTTNFEICMKRKNGKSVRQIAAITRISKTKVHRICQACP